jgi:hypothetical protein
MTDRVEDLVERTVRYTSEILAAKVADWSVARIGLVKIAERIHALTPDHPALEALGRFIISNDARYGEEVSPRPQIVACGTQVD